MGTKIFLNGRISYNRSTWHFTPSHSSQAREVFFVESLMSCIKAVVTLAMVVPATFSFVFPSSQQRTVRTLQSSSSAIDDISAAVDDMLTTPKDELMSVVSTASPIGGKASDSLRSSVNELLTKLEPTNPTDSPATSPLLNGAWDVIYSGYAPGPLASPTRPLALTLYAGGYTPGLAGLSLLRMLPGSFAEVGGLELKIGRDQPRVVATSKVSIAGGGTQNLKVFTNLVAETGLRLKETYSTLEVAGRALDIPQRLRYSRKIFITYLDDELLVVRDESGVPDLLLRKAFPDWLEDNDESSFSSSSSSADSDKSSSKSEKDKEAKDPEVTDEEQFDAKPDYE